ncbi:P-loop containing nucleoside triphosphate hydrolase protein [Staphylotrichum tortipilum]|uniref:P-loop containing nucleoside triphosphate hydrolase protein n=1 Tax=Staphylotrichum tortipilum TaxID=2831512 RepID=A0AAN6MLV7_9PEZI|nr:P-loop containing nucleoside triphosphate hydrolase protein [Staphylotrichum longicolle]
MAKKGKNAGSAPAPASTPAAAPAKSTKKDSKKAAAPSEGDFIVFTNSDKEPKGRRGGPSNAAGGASTTPGTAPDGTPEGPPKPTARQIIGGTSWTGKLPVNLLSEHCQKQKWERPDYNTIKTKEGFSVLVSLAAKNPKTGEVTRLPPFKLPPSHVHLAYKPTALEAKHFAATYALYRVCSMKNLHISLPPDYKSLWKDFEALKKVDVKEGKGWMYEADPFQAARERDEAKAAAEKKKAAAQAAREKAAAEAAGANGPGGALAFRGPGGGGGGGGGSGGGGAHNLMRGWATVPKIEMGNKTRSQLEDLLRRETVWNPHGVVMTAAQKAAIVKEFRDLGFRQSHIEEAIAECKDREETLEWLLVHIPEDDLPRWALPERYTAGVTVAATDLRREGAIKRLAESGYSIDLCRKILDANGGDEGVAAEALQKLLVSSGTASQEAPQEEEIDTWRTPDESWDEEMATLEASFGDKFTRKAPELCQLRLESVVNGTNTNIETYLQFRKTSQYPTQAVLSIVAPLPAYIKLSIIKKALAYAHESLQGEEMKIYFLIDWIQENINEIIERPGALREVAAVSSAASEEPATAAVRTSRRRPRYPKPINWTPSPQSKQQWLSRIEAPAYKKMLSQRERLPAWQVRFDVIRTVAENQVTIISGETGSGKSTQSVQFILDDLYSKGLGNGANMIVTQPRRISALGLADRVAEERCSLVGHEVGYSIRGESRTSPNTKITFVTTGVLLRRLQTSGGRVEDVVASLADVSHIVVDEVHERSLDTDFLLSILRDVLYKRRDLKLILMSATLDAASFRDYFEADRQGVTVGLVEISGRTYPVQDYYLDDVIRMTGFTVWNNRNDYYDDSVRTPSGDQDTDPINKTIQKLGSRINYDLLVETVKGIDEDLASTQKAGGVLIFLPGVAEINRACNALRSVGSLHVLPLHASLETREQKKVFAAPPPGRRKVVVATNVAETSITIDDIVAVIDSGRVKETSFDPANNMRKLEETWASLAACKQRRGRAGRVQAGKCYKLYTRNLEFQMAERPEPEIRRVPLEQLCLAVRAMGIRDVGHFLSRAPTPPEATAVEGAVTLLRRMGALDGDELTALGQQLAMLPADLRCGKLMVYGAIFGCLDECVTIAAILSTRSPFLSPAEKRDEAKAARMRFARGDGDLLTDLRAVQEWDGMMADRATPPRRVRQWCDENFLSFPTLSDIASTRSQFYTSLSEMGIRPSSSTASSASTPLLRALTASAFAPQLCRIQFPDKKFATSVSGAVELDPEAKTIKYFAQDHGRVFIHPASSLFGSQAFSGNAAFLSYFTMMATSKVFIRDLTPFNAYTLLLFAGSIALDTQGRGLVVDGWLRLRGWARIGVLVSRLRGVIDRLIERRVENPTTTTSSSTSPGVGSGATGAAGDKEAEVSAAGEKTVEAEIIRMVTRLVELDGLDA